MSSQLEKYLRQAAVQLHDLPADRREEEIEEIRAHLTAYAAKRQDAGASEDEAMAAAIVQFGDAGEVGRKIARAAGRVPFRAPILALLLLFAVALAYGESAVTRQLASAHLAANAVLGVLVYAGPFVLISICLGLVAGRSAIRWIGIFYALDGLVTQANTYSIVLHNMHASQPSAVHIEIWPIVCWNVMALGLRIAIGVGSAWIGARLAEKLGSRRRERAVPQ